MSVRRVFLLVAFVAALVAAVCGYQGQGFDSPELWLGVTLALVIGGELA